MCKVSNPETVHHVLWQMSDRAIVRSYRMMEGFGINTFRVVDSNVSPLLTSVLTLLTGQLAFR